MVTMIIISTIMLFTEGGPNARLPGIRGPEQGEGHQAGSSQFNHCVW